MFPPIVFLNRFYAPDHSATAQILTDLAEHLVLNGFEVTVIASRAIYGQEGEVLARREAINGVNVIRTYAPRLRGMIGRVGAYLAYLIFSTFAALRIVKRGTILVVKTDPPLLSVPIALVAWLRGAKLVHWLQDLYPEIAAAHGIGLARGATGRMLGGLRNWSLRRAVRVVAIGELMAERIADAALAPGRVAVIPNWADDGRIVRLKQNSPALRSAWGIDPDAFVLAYSGNLGRAHEFETLLGAALRLRDRTEIVFLLIGGGHMLERLAARVAGEGLSSFRFAPYQSRDKLSESLAMGNAHWISLRPEFEGLIVPSKVFGVCAAGRAIISVGALDGELARLLGPAGAGIVVKPGDSEGLAEAIVKLAEDPVQTQEMGSAARALLDAGYSKANALARWQALFGAVAKDILETPPDVSRPARRDGSSF